MITSVNDSILIIMGQSDSAGSSVKTASSKGGIDYWAVNFKYADGALPVSEVFAQQNQLIVMPNPSNGHFQIKPRNMIIPTGESIQVTLTDLMGRIVYSKKQTLSDNIISVDWLTATAGYYQLTIENFKFLWKSSVTVN
jgi:hypothetical protein